MRFSSGIILFSLCSSLYADEAPPPSLCASKAQDNLLKSSHSYIDFVNRIARGEVFNRIDQANILFAPDCKKIFNAAVAAENREDFVADLVSVYQNYRGWKLIPFDIMVSSAKDAAVLHLLIDTENLGINTAMVILYFNADGLISEINEVFSQVKDQYQFETNAN